MQVDQPNGPTRAAWRADFGAPIRGVMNLDREHLEMSLVEYLDHLDRDDRANDCEVR